MKSTPFTGLAADIKTDMLLNLSKSRLHVLMMKGKKT